MNLSYVQYISDRAPLIERSMNPRAAGRLSVRGPSVKQDAQLAESTLNNQPQLK